MGNIVKNSSMWSELLFIHGNIVILDGTKSGTRLGTPVEGRQVEFGACPSVIMDTIHDAMKRVLKSYLNRIFSLNLDMICVREESTAIDLTREALIAQEQLYLHNQISDFFRTKELKKSRMKYEKLKSVKVLVFHLEISGHLWSKELWHNGLTGDAVESKKEWKVLTPTNQSLSIVYRTSPVLANQKMDCGLEIISYDLWEVLGKRGMKIAIKAMFCPQPPEKNSIYPLLQEKKMIVALKCPIIKKLSPGKKLVMKVRLQFDKKAIEDFKLFPSTDENVEVEKEVRQILFAMTLLNSVYVAINAFVPTAVPPPASIPRLCFVTSLIAIADKEKVIPWFETTAPLLKSNKQAKILYIIEELIDDLNLFTKYIYNCGLKPLRGLSQTETVTAEFLCFTQYLQWKLTGGLVFLSDYQGSGKNLLTDPQIMTHLSLGEHLFGDGNIGKMVSLFSVKHHCNNWCKWFKLETALETETEWGAQELKDLQSSIGN
ncbi:hypothetical protein AN958_02347 [Leucoagaricus sp. SymC.cos]|nr:hypothetical protein AN958_02347 [Leucoagaricus sp. SymC.cos]